ncbi:MAG: transcription-repair coupling factor [Myxococcota bacterium]
MHEPENDSEASEPQRSYLQRLMIPDGRVLSGLPGGSAAYALSRLLQPEDPLDEPEIAAPLMVAVSSNDEAERFAAELGFHLKQVGATITVVVFPADDVRTFDGVSPHPDIPRARIQALVRLLNEAPVVVVSSARALMHRVLSEETLMRHCLTLHPGDLLERDDLLVSLTRAGYLTAATVEEPGTVSVRGDTVNVWPTGAAGPARLTFFDDELEEIRSFDPEHRRKSQPLTALEILPAREAIIDDAALARASEQTGFAVDQMGGGHGTRRRVLTELKAGLWFPGAEDYLPALHALVDPLTYTRRLVVIDRDSVAMELRRFGEMTRARWEGVALEERPVVLPALRYTESSDVIDALGEAVCLEEFAPESPDYGAHDNRTLRVGKGDLGPVVDRIRGWLEARWQVALVCESRTRADRITALLTPNGLAPVAPPPSTSLPQGQLNLLLGELPRGFHAPRSQIAYVTADELFGQKSRARRAPKRLRDAALSSFTDLKSGDLVVHVRHGIGRFIGLKRLQLQRSLDSQDYAEIEYRKGDRMYLPVTRLDQLYRYRAMGDASPRLDKLGGETWEKRKKKVADKVLSMASELLEMYALRAVADGYSYAGEPLLYQQFVETFPYVETPDQDTAIRDVLADLAEDEPMDRLVVGDVGFGKTEVAMRAAMRVVLEGHQVAVLCPTTVLAFQHYETFLERFDGFPVEIELLSRFRTAAETRTVLQKTAEGKVDILIGTSALLSRKLRFDHLGLMVVDEEHRFGVRQKEKLKKLGQRSAVAVDYLAMSATPIPRTLHMALSGLRKISMIATPPAGRSAVRTHLIRKSDERIQEHVMHELKRGGQIFYVHNRVQSIQRTATHLQGLLPDARIAVAHGQMNEQALERVLIGFVKREFNLLVTTAIIENGIDLPNVNTMIIDRADRFGLAQLYQLRGRVGRGARRGYCVMMVPSDGTLSRDAMRRMRVLQENTDLGAGFAIASADLEMRGSGNLLGRSQSGHIQAVGLDTYVELLEEAAATARGELSRKRLDPELEIPVSTLLPEDYIPDIDARLTAYRRMATARTRQQVRDLINAWEDTFGEPPRAVLNLGWMAEAKLRCRELGIDRVNWMRVRVSLRFHPSTPVSPARVAQVVGAYPRRLSLSQEAGATTLIARFTPQEGEWPFRFLHWVFRQIEQDADDT